MNILGKHNFQDPNDVVHVIGGKRSMTLSDLMGLLDCQLESNLDKSEPDNGFLPGEESDLSRARLSTFASESFYEVTPEDTPDDFSPDWWLEARYIDSEKKELVAYPNDKSDTPRLMAYAVTTEADGTETLEIVILELRPASGLERVKWVVHRILRRRERCRSKDGTNACLGKCPPGKLCRTIRLRGSVMGDDMTCRCKVPKPLTP
ncbi:hypothetical protein [Kitasatospora sp. Ki12]